MTDHYLNICGQCKWFTFPKRSQRILEHADAFFTHGGINSLHEGLYYGVPLILIPHQFEQLLNARCAARHGAGYIINEQLKDGRLTPLILRQALEAVLSEPTYAEAARRIQKSLQESGGYKQAANELQTYLPKD